MRTAPQDDTQRVLFAYHERDPDQLESPQRHQHRGQRSVHLTDPAAGLSPPAPSDADGRPLVWELTQQQAQLPDDSTVYWCRVVRAPRLATKHHVIKVGAGSGSTTDIT